MLTDWLFRFRSLFRRSVVERELNEELLFHLERQIEAHVAKGLARDEAVRRTRMDFGGLDQIREEHRDARGVRLVEDLWRDIAYALRQLIRARAFSLSALLSLGIGIGTATTIYSIVDAVLLQPLPLPSSDRLVRVVEHFWTPAAGAGILRRGLTYQELEAWKARARTLTDAAGFSGLPQRLVRTDSGAVGLWGASVSGNLFEMMGVRALQGRTLTSKDEGDVVVLSFDTWQRHFKADPAVIGMTVELRAGAIQPSIQPRVLTVVGVLPAEFEFPTGPLDFYTPLSTSDVGRDPRLTVIARLAPDATLDAARAEAATMGNALRPPWPANAPPLTVPRFEVERLKDQAIQPVRPALRVLLAAASLVLVIVCANVTCLLLARSATRQREMAVRLAIGAGRGRLTRQVATECVVLTAAGGALGALVAAVGLMLVKRLATLDAPGMFRFTFGTTVLPRASEVEVDLKMFGIAFAVTAATSVAIGLLPAIHLSRERGMQAVWQAATTQADWSRLRAGLVVAQLAMATTLLVGAGLLANSLLTLSTVNSGYDPRHVLAFNLLFPDDYSLDKKVNTIETLLGHFRQLPGIQAAGFARHGVLIGEELVSDGFVAQGRPAGETRGLRTRVRSVSGGYLSALGVRLLGGRDFAPSDSVSAQAGLVVNRSAARQYFGASNPVGQAMTWYLDDGVARTLVVVGVVEDLRQESPRDNVSPEIFVEYQQYLSLMRRAGTRPLLQDLRGIGFLSFALRVDDEPASSIPNVRQAVTAIDRAIGIDAIVPMAWLVSNAVATERFNAVLLGVFASVATFLAIIGVYGVLGYGVVQRTREVGIRIALGAHPQQVLASVLRQGLALATFGITSGLVAAVGTSSLLRGMLFGVSPLDPLTFIAIGVTLGLVSMLASYIPARSATQISPMAALRNE